ncbi:hypothetical protein [Cellulomonas persica]
MMLAPLPKHVVNACDYDLGQAVKIAEAIIDRTGLADALEWSLTSAVGRPRKATWRMILVVFATAGILGTDMLITKVARVATSMAANGHLPSSVSYDQLTDGLDRFTAELESGRIVTAHTHPLVVDRRTGVVHPCPEGCEGGRPISRERFAALLLLASGYPPGTAPNTTVFAIDSTDFETWAARKSWHRLPDIDTSDGAEEATEDSVDSANSRVDHQWPVRGADGRARHTWDPDAREGYRSGKNLNKKGVFVGLDEHIATAVAELGEASGPHLAVGLATAPAGSSKAAAGLALLDSLEGLVDVRTVLNDRGYSYLKPESWALQLAARHINSVFDLHKAQRGMRPGPIPHTIWVDGGLFSDALPTHLIDLPGFDIGISVQDKIELREKYDQRVPFAYGTQGEADPVTGSQRVRGPALRKTVRCVNNPESMSLPYNRPITNCVKGVGKDGKPSCGCSGTKVLPVDEQAWNRQLSPLWGTTAHAASYARRVAIEELNSDARTNRGITLDRFFTRVLGAPKNHALATFALLGINVRQNRDWHVKRLLADPWLTAIGDTTDPNWAEVHGHRKRKPRVLALHERIVRGEIPGQKPDSLLSRRRNARRRRTSDVAVTTVSFRDEDLPPPA